MAKPDAYDILAIDVVAMLWTHELVKLRPDWGPDFFSGKLGQDSSIVRGMTEDEYLQLMDESGIGRAFLPAVKAGPFGHPPGYRTPINLIADAVGRHPDRFSGLVGIDPFEGMKGVRELEYAVKELGFIGAHLYPHWFELAPDHAKYYPFYAKCVELDVPIQMQVGQSMIYSPDLPRRSVGRPITLDAVACDFPELKVIGTHIGIPWTEEMIAMAWKHKNVFISSDAYAPRYWPPAFIHYLNTYGQDKVVFGTHFPTISFDRARREIEEHNLRPDPMRKLLRDNVQRIYKLN